MLMKKSAFKLLRSITQYPTPRIMKLYIFILSNVALLLASTGLASASSETSLTKGFESDIGQRHLRPPFTYEMRDEERAKVVTPAEVEKKLSRKVPIKALKTYLRDKGIEGNIPESIGKLNVKSADKYYAIFNANYRARLVGDIATLKGKDVDLAAYLILLSSTGSRFPLERVASMLDNGIQDGKSEAAQLEDAQFFAWSTVAPSKKKVKEKIFGGKAESEWKQEVLTRYQYFLQEKQHPRRKRTGPEFLG